MTSGYTPSLGVSVAAVCMVLASGAGAQDTYHGRGGGLRATVPAIFTLMYLQAHRLDTAFYDTHFAPGAYLRTHAAHRQNWG